jgi:transcriptional regulator with XRE-family HTH domain
MDRISRYARRVPQDKTKKRSGITPLSKKVGDLITAAYSGARLEDGTRMTQEILAQRAGYSVTTLQKKLAGTAPINTTDLALLAGAIPFTTAGAILDSAIEQLGGYEKLSEPTATTDDLDTKRKQNEARAMSVEQIEALPNAATDDPELDSDEPPTA